MTGVRAQASQRVRESIVEATVRVVAREGVGAVTHRGVAGEAKVSLSSTTWHFATKAEILEAALDWTARREVESIAAIADRLTDADFDPEAWADALADWLCAQVTTDREQTIALYRLQAELLGAPGVPELHREWGDGLRAVGRAGAADRRRRPAAHHRRPRRTADHRAQRRRSQLVAPDRLASAHSTARLSARCTSSACRPRASCVWPSVVSGSWPVSAFTRSSRFETVWRWA